MQTSGNKDYTSSLLQAWIYSVGVSVFLGGNKPLRTGDVRGDISVNFTCDPKISWKLLFCFVISIIRFSEKLDDGVIPSYCIKVCAYKDGEVVIETSAGVIAEDDPRPVQHDTLFNVFSATKAVAAGMIHWLVDKGVIQLDQRVDDVWPGFGINGKESIKVHHVLNHTAGLHNTTPDALLDPSLMTNWEECLREIVASVPDSEPEQKSLYHHTSFGWLCGGIIEHASGKKFQEVMANSISVFLQAWNLDD